MSLGSALARRQVVVAGIVMLAGAPGLAALGAEPRALTLDPWEAAATTRGGQDLTLIPLEDLMNIEVYSASKQRQRLSEAPAAVSVITQEDIRRSGMNTIAEMLRLAPGVAVAQTTSNQWSVGTRGVNGLYNNNLLVLMDGRTLYTPLFSGVYWDTADYVLADLDRIEVVRGPGATLWGANAVNGVINIVTKDAKDTQGFLSQSYAGTDGLTQSLRYGGKVDNRVFYRVYAKYRNMSDFELANGDNAPDGWDARRMGFRVDARVTDQDVVTVQGDIFEQRFGHIHPHVTFVPPGVHESTEINNAGGGNFLARWTHKFSPDSELMVQAYYDRLEYPAAGVGFKQDTSDIELQHRFGLAGFQEITWGAGYRFISDSTSQQGDGPTGVMLSPPATQTHLFSFFVQDNLTLVRDRLHLIAGTKVEHNDYTGWEFQPSARLLLTPDQRNTLWVAASRAVRTPSRWEVAGQSTYRVVPGRPLPVAFDFSGNPDFRSESVVALEGGYKVEPTKSLSLDLSLFYNWHDGYRGFPSGTPRLARTPVPHMVVPLTVGNDYRGNSYGGELAAKWQVSDRWQLAGSYSYAAMNVRSISGNFAPETLRAIEGTYPNHQVGVRSYVAVTRDIDLNAAVYYVHELPGISIPSYIRGDVNVAWRPAKGVEVTAGVRNLFDGGHAEFREGTERLTNTEIPRTLFLQLDVRF